MEPRSGYIFCLNRPPDHLNVWGPISQLLLIRSLPNFKGRFMRPSVTADKCHWEICPCNIFSGHNFFGQENFFFWTPIDFSNQHLFYLKIVLDLKFFCIHIFGCQIFSDPDFFKPQFFLWRQNFIFDSWLFLPKIFFRSKYFFCIMNFWI